MNRISAWQRCGALLLGCALAAISGAAPTAAEEPVLEDPLPLRRVLLQPERLPAEMERAKAGLLKQLPREEFERLVQRAAQAGKALKNPCRLVEAHYRARLEGSALVDGVGEWKIVNSGPVAGILPLGPLSLALQKAAWQNKQEAVLGDLEGKGLSLLVEQPGEGVLNLDWTARAHTQPGELHFELNLPAAAVATLELDLPSDYLVTVDRDVCLLSGPRPAAQADHRQWRIGFAGQAQVLLTLRRAASPGRPPLVLARLQTRQDLAPGQLQADFDFDLEVLHQGVQQFTLECDPGLKPYEIIVRNLEGWDFKSGASATVPSTLVVRLREPFQGPRLALQVRCLASLSSDRTWSSPGLRLTGAVFRGETLTLRVDPDVQLDDWQPGSFLLTDPPAGAGSDSWQVLTLTAGLEAKPGAPRPSARVKAQGPEFRVRQLTWWQVGPDRTALRANLTYEVAHGRLFQLLVQLPAGWEAHHVQMTPSQYLRSWALLTENDRSTLVVDLQRPLALGAPPQPQLEVRLRPLKPQPLDRGWSAAFPDLVPLGPPRLREGTLAISLDPRFQATVTLKTDPAAALVPVPAAIQGPWGETAPDHVYAYRGPAVEGNLNLEKRPTQVRARCRSQLVLISGRAAMAVRLELEPMVGNPDTLELLTSVPVAGEWKAWKTLPESNLVKSMQRLPDAGPGGTERWRLNLARPLQQRVTLETTLELPAHGDELAAEGIALLGCPHPLFALTTAASLQTRAAPRGGRHWQVPLVLVPAAEKLDGEVTLHLAGADLVRVEAKGLQQSAASGPSSWQTFRYARPPLALTLWGNAPEIDRSREAVADQAHLTVFADRAGRLLHHYQVHLWNWRQRTLPLGLPVEAELLAARVDGRWIDRLGPGGASVPVQSGGKTMQVLELPMAGGTSLHRLEVVYSVPLLPWSVGTRLQAVAPSLPVQTAFLRQTWKLPPGILPVRTEGLQRLPGTLAINSGGSPTPEALLSWPFGLNPAGDWEQQQRAALTGALASVRRDQPLEATWRLGSFLERLAAACQADQQTLFLDAAALQQASLEPETLVGEVVLVGLEPPPAGALSPVIYLVLVPTRQGPVLTTWRQWSAWRAAGSVEAIGQALEEALRGAAAHGQDGSGRLFQVVPWLKTASDASEPGRAPVPSRVPLLPEGLGADWTEWEPLAGTVDPEKLLVLRADVPRLGGLFLASVLAVGVVRWWSRADQRRRLAWLLAWLTVAGLGMLWLPQSLQALAWWPALAGLCLGVAALLMHHPRHLPPVPSSVVRPVAAGALLAALLGLVGTRMLAQAPEPEPATVWLLPGPQGTPEQQTVLVAPEVVEQLEALARQGTASMRGAVLLSGHYRGRVSGPNAQLAATYRAQGFGPGPISLTLPLAGAQLQEAFVNGAPAFPQRVTAPREGLVVKLPGPGLHTIELRMSLRLPETGEDQELRFSIPELALNKLANLEVAGNVRYLQALTIRGAQQVQPLAGAAGQELQADLGRINTLHIRWRREAADSRQLPAVVRVQSASLWDLRTESARLLAVLRYTIQEGAVTTLAADLPRDTDVRSVEAEASPLPGGTPGPRLRDWQVAEEGANRRLQMEFQGPLTGSVQVTLELVPRLPLGTRPVLYFPQPLGTAPGKDATAAWLAYRVEGLEATLAEFSALRGIDRQSMAETFAQTFARPWLAARQESLEQPATAFWGTPGGTPFVRLSLQQSPARTQYEQDLAWFLTRQQTEVQATVKVTTLEGSLPLVDWEVPAALTVANVSGPHVRYWSRTAGRIQVWFQKPVKQTTLSLTGWLPKRGPDPNRFQLPQLRLAGMQSVQTTIKISAGDGLALKPEALKNLRPQGSGQTPAAQLSYLADPAPYTGMFQLVPAPAPPALSLLTFAEVRDQRFIFTANIYCPPSRAEPRTLAVTLRNWDGTAKVEAPAAGSVQPRVTPRQTAAGRIWVVELPAGLTDAYRLTLSGTMRVQPGAEVLMPDIRVEGTVPGMVQVQRWLAIAGPELFAEPLAGLESIRDPVRALPLWGGEMERVRRAGGSAWKVAGDDWRLRLRVRSRSSAGGAVQVVLTEHQASVFHGAAGPAPAAWRWLHQATCWVYHEAGTDLVFGLPAGAEILGVAVDGVSLPPLQPEPDRLWVALTGGSGVRQVRLRWTLAATQESLDRPNLETPAIKDVPPGPVLWTVNVPVGYYLAPSSVRVPAAATAAGQELRRTEAQLRLCQLLADQAPANPRLISALAASRDRFLLGCRRADQLLALPTAGVADQGPDGQSLADWLLTLRSQYRLLARTQDLDRLPAEPDEPDANLESWLAADTAAGKGPVHRGPLSEPLLSRGTPTYWHGPGGDEPLRLHLTADQTVRVQHHLALTILMLILVLIWWALTQTTARPPWPELLALLGFLGLVLFRTSWGHLFWLLPAIGLSARLWLGSQRLWTWWTAPRPAPAIDAGGEAPA